MKEGQVCVCAFCQQKVLQTKGKSHLILWWLTRIALHNSDEFQRLKLPQVRVTWPFHYYHKRLLFSCLETGYQARNLEG